LQRTHARLSFPSLDAALAFQHGTNANTAGAQASSIERQARQAGTQAPCAAQPRRAKEGEEEEDRFVAFQALMTEGRSAAWRWVRRALVLVAVAGLVYLFWAVWDQEAWLAWMRRARPLPFFVGLTLLPAIGFPVSPLFILAGAIFGTRVGLIGSLIALALNLALCYSIARLMRPGIAALMRRFRYELPNVGERKRSAFRFTAAVKLAPGVPAFVKNYGLGVAGVPFGLYFGASMLITGAYGVALVLLGESLLDHQADRSVWLGGAVLAAALGVSLWRRRRRRERSTLGPEQHSRQ
jgi:uncharacterized membrane protein YdjX (TVP38/TMEM64 family)